MARTGLHPVHSPYVVVAPRQSVRRQSVLLVERSVKARACIAAFTEFTEFKSPPSGEYVKFVSINRVQDGVSIMVRNQKGECNEVVLNPDDWRELRQDIIEWGEVS